jgi:protein-histidine N-methyltransferase
MAFSFNFGGDDIDETVDDDICMPATSNMDTTRTAPSQQALPTVQQHTLQSLYETLPDRLCYNTTSITSPTGKTLLLPRREIFDMRVQLMSEASSENDNDATLLDLQQSDLRTNVYEGGFKTWECSVDLASLLLDGGPRKDMHHLERCDVIVELGAGSALPSLTLFHHCLSNNAQSTRATMQFALADYNAAVLRLVTLPNLLLTWATTTSPPLIDLSAAPCGDLEHIPTLFSAFSTALATANINLAFFSGPWSPALASLIMPSFSAPAMPTPLILASETIYAPASTEAFVALLLALLQGNQRAKAIVAAKRFYFGVGGSVDQFKEMCAREGAVACEVEDSGVQGMDHGVGRTLVEVRMY